MIQILVLFVCFALKKSLLQHLPELLLIMEIDLLLAICLDEGKLRVTLVDLKSGCFPHSSILMLPIMSS